MNTRKAKRGSALLMVLIIVFFMMIIGVGVLSLGFHGRLAAVRSGTDIIARCAADAAIAHAVCQMNEKLKVKPWDDSFLPSASSMSLPNCDATCDYTVSNIGGNYVIHATGRAGHSVRAIEGILRVQSVFDYAIFAKDSIELKNSATIDWINNQPDDWPMQVGTNSINNSAVTFKNGSNVKSDVVVGFGGNPLDVINGIEQVQGNAYAMFSKVVLPSMVAPDGLTTIADITNTTTISTAGKYQCNTINLKSSDKLTITEPVTLYITGNIRLKNSAEIIIGGAMDGDNDANLIIYLAGSATFDNSAQINNLTNDATRFTLFGLDSCVDVRLKNGSTFFGAVYAPNASIILDNSVSTYGSIIGKNFILKNSGTFYYDANLRDRTVNDEAIRFAIKRWSEQ